MFEARALNAFLKQYLDDQSSGTRRVLAEYQALFPGHDELIAERYSRYEAEGRDARSDLPFSDLDRIGPYRILSELGRGGQGVVYLAEDDRLHRNVALKVLTGLGSLTPDRIARFLREAEVASRLDQPGIATVYEIGTHAGVPYIAMRYVEGGTLAGRICTAKEADGGTWPMAEIVSIAENAARALHAAHEAGVIHRDVKPGNILIAASGDPVIVDFGLAHDADGSLATITKSGEFFGTPAYMSPEQITTQKIAPDRRTDVWSLGATLYECLTLTRPFEAPTREQLYRAILSLEPQDPRRVNPAIPEDLAAIVETALQKEADRRYQTTAALADDLAAFREGRPVAARRVGLIGSLSRWSRREPAKAILLLLSLVALPTIAALVTVQAGNRQKVEAARLAQLQEDKDELLSQGSYEIGEGDADLAIPCFERALAMEGESPEAVVGIALAHLKRNRPKEALEILDGRSSLVQGIRPAVMLRAACLRALGNDADARSLESNAPPPRNAVDFYLEAERLIEEGHAGRIAAFKEALSGFRKAIYLSTSPRAIYFQGVAHAASHAQDQDAACEIAQALRRHWPRSAVCAAWAGFALSPFSVDEAIAALREAIRLEPDYGMAHGNLGCALMTRSLDEAIVSLREAIRLQPGLFEAHFNLGMVLDEKGLLDDAIASYRDAIRLRPGNGRPYYKLGTALERKGLVDEAIAAYREAVRVGPDLAEAHYNLGVVLVTKGLVDDAIAAYRAATRIQPGMVEAHSNLGNALASKGLIDDAIASCGEAIRLRPADAPAHYNLGRALARTGFHDRAIASFREAVRHRPDFAEAHYNLGVSLDARHDFDDAIDSYREAVRINPKHAEAHCNLGRDLVRIGRLAAAAEAMRRGHELGILQAAWPYPSAAWVEELEQLVRDEQRMLEVASGREEDAGTADVLRLADLASLTGRWELAAKWYEAALRSEPTLMDGPEEWGRKAGRAAVQAARSSPAESRASSGTQDSRFRNLALEWLQREIRRRQRLVDDGSWDAGGFGRSLAPWLSDPLLAPVRDEAPASMLPPEEARAWRGFWQDVRKAVQAR